MVWCETVIAYSAVVNAATVALATLPASAPLTTRIGRGKPKITHMMFFASTNDITNCYVVPQGIVDSNGIPIEYGVVYGATAQFDLSRAKLKTPIELKENNLLTIYATSETAANTVVFAYIVLEYPDPSGKFVDIQSGPIVRRAWEHGAALVSVVEANSTDITTLYPGRKYQPAKITGVAVNGATAGIVGPAFLKFRNPEMGGAQYLIPLCNAGSYLATGAMVPGADLVDAGMKMPIFEGGTALMSSCVGYTAEQPQAEISFGTGSIFS